MPISFSEWKAGWGPRNDRAETNDRENDVSLDKNTLEGLKIDRDRAPQRGGSWGFVILALVLIVMLASGGIWWMRRPKATPVQTVTVQAPSGGGERTLLNASGYVTARREATVSSKVTGKVVEVMVEEGMKVQEGQILARLDSSNVEQNLKLTEAQLESSRKALEETRVNLDQAERERKRARELAASNVASQADLDRAEADANSLRARLERQEADVAVAEHEVAVWKQQLDDTIIRAPFAGVVTSKNAQPGEMISPMSAGGFTRTGICTIVDMSSLEIEVDVNESYINRVQPGQPVEATLDAYPDWRIPAKVIAIIPTADRQKATVKVRVAFEKLDPRILPEMSAKVAFQSGEEARVENPGIRIPKSAVYQRNGRSIVWVVRNGEVEQRAVTIDTERGDEAVIAAGLNGGEKIVARGGENLNNGSQVSEKKP